MYTSILSLSTKNIKPRLEQIEKELVETKSSLVELLKTVSIISKEFVHKDEIEQLINPQNQEDLSDKLDIKFMSLSKQINDAENQLTNFVHTAVDSIEKKFAMIRKDFSHKLNKKIKSNQEEKFVSEEKFQTWSKQVEKLQTFPFNISQHVNALTDNLTITRDEFAKFQLTVARDMAHVKVLFSCEVVLILWCHLVPGGSVGHLSKKRPV